MTIRDGYYRRYTGEEFKIVNINDVDVRMTEPDGNTINYPNFISMLVRSDPFYTFIRPLKEVEPDPEPIAAEPIYIYLAVLRKQNGGTHSVCHHLEATWNMMIRQSELTAGMTVISRKRIKINP